MCLELPFSPIFYTRQYIRHLTHAEDHKPLQVFDYQALSGDARIDPTTIGLKGSPTNIFKSFTPPQKGHGVMLGDSVAALTDEIGGCGADRVLLCESPLLKDYTTDAYTKVIADVVLAEKPEIFLIGATNIGRDLGPRLAARLHTGLTADCTHLDVDVAKYKDFLRTSSTIDVDHTVFDKADRNLKMTRPAFGGHLMATIICPRFRPCMSTVRPGVIKRANTTPIRPLPAKWCVRLLHSLIQTALPAFIRS